MANTNSLIQKFEQLNKELLPNKNGKTGIKQLSNDEKKEMSTRIANLAKNIYDKAITIKKSGPDFIELKKTLTSLYNLYRAIFIDNFRLYGQNLKNVQGVDNNKLQIALNLREKNNKLKQINNNEQKQPRGEPMGFSFGVNRL